MSSPTTAPQTQLTEQWAMWIAENALAGLSTTQIVDAMVEGGFDRSQAQKHVEAAFRSPYLHVAAKLGVGQQAGGQAEPSNGGGSKRAAKNAWFLEVARRNAKLASDWGTVPRVQKPSREEFLDRFYSQNKPVVIEGALDDWPALEKWQSGDYLKERCGDAIVEVQANRESDDDYELNSIKHKQEMRFSEFVDIVESGVETNDWYMTANNSGKNKQAIRALWDDIRFPDYLNPNHAYGDGFFWYGPAGTVTPIHHDMTNNFMAQVRGRKRVKIIAPFESAHVYNHRHCFSPVDIENPDLERFPDMKDVSIIDVEISPGDLFFLPVGWWHGVRGLDLSITMTFTNFVYPNEFSSGYTTYDMID